MAKKKKDKDIEIEVCYVCRKDFETRYMKKYFKLPNKEREGCISFKMCDCCRSEELASDDRKRQRKSKEYKCTKEQ